MGLTPMSDVLAIDIGGTNIKVGLVDNKSQLSQQQSYPTPTLFADFTMLLNTIKQAYVPHDYRGVAVSSPGIPLSSGMIGADSAVPYLHEHNILNLFKRTFHLPVTIENDANCAALAEIWSGNARTEKNVATLIIGTGIGGAIIQDRKIFHGNHHHAGDFGYMLFPTETGELSVFSRLASTSSIIRYVAKKKAEPVSSWSGEKVFELAKAKDPICQEAIDRFYSMLSLGIYNIQYVYDPDVILIGGGISSRKELLDELRSRLITIQTETPEKLVVPKVMVCYHKNHANLLGAAYHFMISGEVTDK
ncbi:Sugar kinase of the NBD/HSP70 family, may contain an N-terminal HTH domain [Halolactibacillus miurensis]|uniref:Sugar kinase of the NBD/HSP70 family, may contain an N-terminal HTH domain n=2 Tax=Halolactibacillus miurensis TaxID=306541 RepID=A0A1I6NYU1_9BACI|nr:Sugar kinase of the NBD/HSP70 family, may contain an N-terminal HTH domain [Halolactibacillus miurensis]